MTTPLLIVALIIGLNLYRLISKETATKKSNDNLASSLTINKFVEKYNQNLGLVKGGTLCFYGHWFGRPYDNYHRLEVAAFDNTTKALTLTFNEKETLTISNPQDICEFENKLTIRSADNIYWKWFSYGKSRTDDNLYFIEINRQDNLLSGKSNVDWYKLDFKDLDIKKPSILWIGQ